MSGYQRNGWDYSRFTWLSSLEGGWRLPNVRGSLIAGKGGCEQHSLPDSPDISIYQLLKTSFFTTSCTVLPSYVNSTLNCLRNQSVHVWKRCEEAAHFAPGCLHLTGWRSRALNPLHLHQGRKIGFTPHISPIATICQHSHCLKMTTTTILLSLTPDLDWRTSSYTVSRLCRDP